MSKKRAKTLIFFSKKIIRRAGFNENFPNRVEVKNFFRKIFTKNKKNCQKCLFRPPHTAVSQQCVWCGIRGPEGGQKYVEKNVEKKILEIFNFRKK